MTIRLCEVRRRAALCVPPAMAASQRPRAMGSWWSQFAASALRVKQAPSLFGNDPLAKRLAGNAGPVAALSRKLGLADLILLGIGASIGAGIFVVTGTVAHDAGPGTFQDLVPPVFFSFLFITVLLMSCSLHLHLLLLAFPRICLGFFYFFWFKLESVSIYFSPC